MLGFEELLSAHILSPEFGTAPYQQSFRPRPHISKMKVEAHGACAYLAAGSGIAAQLTPTGAAFVAAASLANELFATVYDVNTTRIAAYRAQPADANATAFIERFVAQQRNANLEARLIGLQNHASFALVAELARTLMRHRIPLVEVDLFGTLMRHICIEVRTGSSLNILMENRLYKPGELDTHAPARR